MKQLLMLLIMAISSITSYGQSIFLYKLDTTNFPKMSAKFVAFDRNGYVVKPNINDLKLTENGIERKITSVSCPTPKPPNAISSVIVLDVSGSMENSDLGKRRIDMAKTAAKSWVRALPQSNSECAITTFDNFSFLNRDYTSDTTKLIEAIENITPHNGTDYMAALLYPVAGGLEITKLAKYQKLIIFITDGLPNFEPDVNAIVAEARRQNCIIVSVTLNMPAPFCIKNITKATGGEYYENITTLQEAQAVYNAILQKSLGTDLCDIAWESGIHCKDEIVDVELSWNGAVGKDSYEIPLDKVTKLKVEPEFINFGAVESNVFHDSTITLTAINNDITINDIVVKYGGSEFAIDSITYPFTLPKGTSKEIKVSCYVLDSNLYYNSFEVITDNCNADFSASCGEPGRQMAKPTLVLTKPEAIDPLVKGGNVSIEWKGISPRDTVSLYYSKFNSNEWEEITDKAVGLKYNWELPSKLTIDSLQFKVVQLNRNTNIPDSRSFRPVNVDIFSSCVSPNSDYFITAQDESSARIWDIKTGELFNEIYDFGTRPYLTIFSPDGTRTASLTTFSRIIIWDVYGRKKIIKFSCAERVNSIAFSNDGRKLISCGGSQNPRIWDMKSETTPISVFNTYPLSNSYNFERAVFSPDDKSIAIAGGNNILFFNVSNGVMTKKIVIDSNISWMNYDKTGTKLIVSTYSNVVYILDIATEQKITFPLEHKSRVRKVVYSPNYMMAATASDDGTAIIWDLLNMQMINKVKHSSPVNAVSFTSDNAFLVSSDSKEIKITRCKENILQSNISNVPLSVFSPISKSKDIDLSKCLFGSTQETYIQNYIVNAGSYKFKVDTIYFTGIDSQSFQLVSNFQSFEVSPNSSKDLEFRFIPNRIGKHKAQVVIVTQSDTLVQKIEGLGVEPLLKTHQQIVNFGVLDMGDSKTLSQVPIISNVGSIPIKLNNVEIQNVNDTNFKILTSLNQTILQPGDTLKLDLEYAPKQDGRTSGHLYIYNDVTNTPEIIQLFGTANLPKVQIFNTDFGIVELFSQKDTLVPILQNNGKAEIVILDCKINDSKDFELIGNSFPLIINPNEVAKLNIRYKPFSTGFSSGTLSIYQNGKGGLTQTALKGLSVSDYIFSEQKPIISIYSLKPNPASDFIEIYYGFNSLDKADVKITSILGTVIYNNSLEKTENGYMKIDLRNFSNGQYYITFSSQNVIKQHTITIVK